jgi:glycosyltransferase involved in cell wall biosynthesis
MAKFSIGIVNYNKGKYIKQAILSVILQDFKDWELIIVDDNSNDDSLEIIDDFLNKKYDIKLIQHTYNLGCGNAWNTIANNVNSPYLGMLDSDDILLPNAIETMYNFHIKYPECGLIYSQFIYCDEQMNFIKQGYCKEINVDNNITSKNAVSHFKTLKINYYKQTQGFHKTLKAAIDKDIIFKMEEIAPLKFIDKKLYLYRQYEDGISQGDNVKKAKENGAIAVQEANIRRQKNAEI